MADMLEGEQSRYVVDDYLELGYVLGGQWFGTLANYVEDDYVIAGYVEQTALQLRTELVVEAVISRGVAVEADPITLAVTASVAATAGFNIDAAASIATTTTCAATAGLLLNSTADLASVSQLTAAGNFILTGTVSMDTVATCAATGGSLLSASSDIASQAAIAIAPTLFKGADVAMSVLTTAVATGNYIIGGNSTLATQIDTAITAGLLISIDEPYPAYTWDSVTNWDQWPCGVWGPNGITLCGQHTMSVAASVDHAALDQQLDVVAELTGLGGRILGSVASIFPAAEAEVTVQGNHIFAGEPIIDAEFGVDTTANYIFTLKETISLDMQSGLTSLAGLELGGRTTTPAEFDLTVDQSGNNGTSGILFAGQADLATQAILSSLGGITFRGQATMNAFNAVVVVGVFIYRDPFRSIRVEPESRVLYVEARPRNLVDSDTRVILVLQDTRVIYVDEESRILDPGIAPYDTIYRRKV